MDGWMDGVKEREKEMETRKVHGLEKLHGFTEICSDSCCRKIQNKTEPFSNLEGK